MKAGKYFNIGKSGLNIRTLSESSKIKGFEIIGFDAWEVFSIKDALFISKFILKNIILNKIKNIF